MESKTVKLQALGYTRNGLQGLVQLLIFVVDLMGYIISHRLFTREICLLDDEC